MWPPFFVVLEHVVARAGGRQQHGIARLRGAPRPLDDVLEGRATLEWHLPFEILLDERTRFPVRDHEATTIGEQRRETGVGLAFVPAAEQQHEWPLHRDHRHRRGRYSWPWNR